MLRETHATVLSCYVSVAYQRKKSGFAIDFLNLVLSFLRLIYFYIYLCDCSRKLSGILLPFFVWMWILVLAGLRLILWINYFPYSSFFVDTITKWNCPVCAFFFFFSFFFFFLEESMCLFFSFLRREKGNSRVTVIVPRLMVQLGKPMGTTSSNWSSETPNPHTPQTLLVFGTSRNCNYTLHENSNLRCGETSTVTYQLYHTCWWCMCVFLSVKN